MCRRTASTTGNSKNIALFILTVPYSVSIIITFLPFGLCFFAYMLNVALYTLEKYVPNKLLW